MSNWITPPTFVDGDPIRAEDLQALWADLYLLKNPLFGAQYNDGGGSNTWSFSTVGAWTDIDTTAYQMEFESDGNPLLVWATLRASHSAANGDVYFRFVLDGVAQGSTSYQGYYRNLTQPETRMLADVIEADDGAHTLGVQVNNGDTGNALVYKYQCLGLFVAKL